MQYFIDEVRVSLDEGVNTRDLHVRDRSQLTAQIRYHRVVRIVGGAILPHREVFADAAARAYS